MTTTTLDCLPNELLRMIFDQLSVTDHIQLSRLCRSFRTIVDDIVRVSTQGLMYIDFDREVFKTISEYGEDSQNVVNENVGEKPCEHCEAARESVRRSDEDNKHSDTTKRVRIVRYMGGLWSRFARKCSKIRRRCTRPALTIDFFDYNVNERVQVVPHKCSHVTRKRMPKASSIDARNFNVPKRGRLVRFVGDRWEHCVQGYLSKLKNHNIQVCFPFAMVTLPESGVPTCNLGSFPVQFDTLLVKQPSPASVRRELPEQLHSWSQYVVSLLDVDYILPPSLIDRLKSPEVDGWLTVEGVLHLLQVFTTTSHPFHIRKWRFSVVGDPAEVLEAATKNYGFGLASPGFMWFMRTVDGSAHILQLREPDYEESSENFVTLQLSMVLGFGY